MKEMSKYRDDPFNVIMTSFSGANEQVQRLETAVTTMTNDSNNLTVYLGEE